MKTLFRLLLLGLLLGNPLHHARAQTDGGLASTALYKQRLLLGGGPGFITVYANTPLAHRNSKIMRAVVVVHGAGRDADEYFRSAMAATYLANALNDTLVVAPRFAASDAECHDATEGHELTWGCDAWKFGEASSNDPAVNSFQVMDEILRQVVSPERFPNVARIVVLGHSAGAQYVIRYAIANRVDETLRIRPTYFSINPSSYPYLDRFRPLHATDPTRTDTQLGPERSDLSTDIGAVNIREIRDPEGCTGFDDWPYGLSARKGYTASVTPAEFQHHFVGRHLTLLVGQQDSVPLGGLDTSCPAMFQGANRLERALNFARYGRDRYQVDHPVVVVPLCGHNARCMLTSPVTLPLIFKP
jgi:pimeloyl-ACP methyl ester carboxylesterase